MKNLQLFSLFRDKIGATEQGLKKFLFVNDKLYVVSNGTLTEHEKGVTRVIKCIVHDILQFEYLNEEQQLWIGSKAGFFCIDCISKEVKSITLEGEKVQGEPLYESAAWSPSQEYLVVIKSGGEVQLYAPSLRNTVLVCLGITFFSVDVSYGICMGWGSDKRQYRSPDEQAEIAKFKDEKPIEENDTTPIVTWRSNSTTFAVNSMVKGVRKLKVFEYPCTLKYQSEEVVGLQAPTVWRPGKNWITTFVWTDKRCQIVIFERRCLERCRFNLTRNARVDKLQWLDSGELLAVLQGGDESTPSNIDLYYFDNYQMLLKQRLIFDDSVPLLTFDFIKEESSLTFLKVATSKEIITYSFKYQYCTGQLLDISQSIFLLISGCEIWITFSGDGVLLPMPGNLKVVMDHPVNFIVLNPENHNLAVIDCFDVLTIFKLKRDGVDKLYTVNLRKEKEYVCPLQYYHFTWMKNNKLFFVSENISQDQMIDVCSLEQSNENWLFKTNCVSQKGVNYSDILANSDITLEEKFLLKWCNTIGKAVHHLYLKLIYINGNLYVFSLTSTHEFHVNNTFTADCISSFIISEGYVFMTSVGDKLMGTRLNEQEINNLLNNVSPIMYKRTMEHGAVLICGIPGSSSLVLHIPRGNIEICCCRLITVDLVEKYLKKGNWQEATYLTRLEKVNMNVLIDLNIDRFIENIQSFLEAVEKPSIFTELVFDLEDNNVFEEKYSDCKIEIHKSEYIKTEVVCSKMIEYMENTNFTYYLTSLIAAHFVKDATATAHHFLGYIKGILELPNAQHFMDLAESAFSFICTLILPQELYEGALLTYDVNLMRFVAQNAKMEQLGYQLFLKKLMSLDEVNRRFSINHFVKRHYQAYQYLSRCTSDTDELLNYIETHNIASQVIWDLEEKDLGSKLHQRITHNVCTSLTLQKKYEEAATLYYKANLLNEAFLSYRSALCWTEAIHVLNKMELNEEEYAKKLETVVQTLIKEGQLGNAAKIYENYLNKLENAFSLYLEHNTFKEALWMSRKFSNPDVYESRILTCIVQYSSMLLTKITQMSEEYIKYKTRLVALRNEKRRNYENQGIKGAYLEDFNQTETADTISIIGTSTVASTMHTKSTPLSARSRRKQEMKKHRIKVGGAYEDIAIIQALYKLIKETFDLGSSVREMCITVQTIKNVSKPPQPVIKVYKQLLDLQTLMKKGVSEIWPSNLNLINNPPVDMAMYENVHVMDPTYRQPPPNLSVSWEMSVFPLK